MKAKLFFIISIICFFAISSCNKPIPPEEPEARKKYLSKMLSGDSTSILEICTWDSLGRLISYNIPSNLSLCETNYYYNDLNQVIRIDGRDWEYGYCYYLLYWNEENENELDYVDFYLNKVSTYLYDESFFLESRYTYSYDENSKCIAIYRDGVSVETFNLKWDGNNLIKAPRYDIEYTDNPNIYGTFPNILLLHFGRLIFNPSENNPTGDYEYDEEGYPIKQYFTIDGERKLICRFVYN